MTTAQDVLDKWISTLRSDEYRQGRGYLRQPVEEMDAYCCLGVLCGSCAARLDDDMSRRVAVSA